MSSAEVLANHQCKSAVSDYKEAIYQTMLKIVPMLLQRQQMEIAKDVVHKAEVYFTDAEMLRSVRAPLLQSLKASVSTATAETVCDASANLCTLVEMDQGLAIALVSEI